jgi:TRAP-type C4-dicarboxylate transport system substrate-binding protein
MKKTSAVAKATPKKVATKKVAQKKEKRSIGKIEINYINHGENADATMKVWRMSKIEVLTILTELAKRMSEEMMNEFPFLKSKSETKKVATKKTTKNK